MTRNAILLVDDADERRVHGADVLTALAEAGAARRRPIVTTTLAMSLSILPLALGESGGFHAPMARAVIGGLLT